MLKTVTITGADDSISPAELLELSKKYPFVEWGILTSQDSKGVKRFPSQGWLRELFGIWESNPGVLKLSCHLCGYYVKSLCEGGTAFLNDLSSVFSMFNRVQLNFHAEPHSSNYMMVGTLKIFTGREWIFQLDGVNDQLYKNAINQGVFASALFDLSHGAGILPDEWPAPIEASKCGYAGGLTPENIHDQLLIISASAAYTDFWIDLETGVRSDNDTQFDLQKVEQVLLIANKFISGNEFPSETEKTADAATTGTTENVVDPNLSTSPSEPVADQTKTTDTGAISDTSNTNTETPGPVASQISEEQATPAQSEPTQAESTADVNTPPVTQPEVKTEEQLNAEATQADTLPDDVPPVSDVPTTPAQVDATPAPAATQDTTKK